MKWKILLIALTTMALSVSCKKNSEDTSEESDSSESVATEALSEASAHASASEGGTSGIASSISSQMDVMEEELRYAKDHLAVSGDEVNQLATTCGYSNRTCSAGVGTIDWNSCSLGVSSITMTGGWSETWTNVGDCTNGYLSTSSSVTRSSTSGSVVNFAAGATITTDTKGGTYNGTTTFATGGVITTRSNTTTRTIAMSPTNSAVHKVYKGRRGTTLFDYYIVPSLTVTGARKNGNSSGLGSTSANRSISGTVSLYHNLALYTATNTFNAVTWSDSTCCYPTSGSVSTVFTGSSSLSSMTTTFTSTCGSATVAINGGAASAITLTNCQ